MKATSQKIKSNFNKEKMYKSTAKTTLISLTLYMVQKEKKKKNEQSE